MDWTLICVLIFSGMILIILEVFILPGMIAGVLGGIAVLFGMYQAYAVYGTQAGIITTFVTLFVSVLLFALLFRSKTWKKAALNDMITSKVNIDSEKLKEGDVGITITRLYPIGKAEVNGIICEVQSISGIIEQNTNIIITKIEGYKIFVVKDNEKE